MARKKRYNLVDKSVRGWSKFSKPVRYTIVGVVVTAVVVYLTLGAKSTMESSGVPFSYVGMAIFWVLVALVVTLIVLGVKALVRTSSGTGSGTGDSSDDDIQGW